jgi:transcriptional regulator with XRE-family HTH domain
LGETFRRARRHSGMSQRELAELTGMSKGFLSRLENDRVSPTWSSVQRVAAAMDCVASVRLTTSEEALAAAAKSLLGKTPLQRLLAQPTPTIEALIFLTSSPNLRFAFTGAVAGLLQGLPTTVHNMHVLVPDDDESVLAMEAALRSASRLFEPVGAQWLRNTSGRSWVFGESDVVVEFVSELPPVVMVDVDGIPTPVVAITELLRDADTLG